MSSFIRRFPLLLGSIAVAALLASCMEKGGAPAILAPTGPALGYAPQYPCDFDPISAAPTCTGTVSPDTTLWEQLVVCKYYTEGTGPDVEIKLTADFVKFPESPGPQQGESNTYTLKSGQCKTLWRNGEYVGNVRSTDTITVTETPVPGYTAQSQVTTIIRNEDLPGPDRTFTTDTGLVTTATTIKTAIGGARIPGAQVVFINTKIVPHPQPSCTFTQGYWKNHETAWPAPYSPTAQWLDASHKVNGVTWDGLMGKSVAGGNSYMQLAHQWIAATLNLAGATSNNPTVAAAMSQGEAWLKANTPASTNAVPNLKNAQATAWASTLDDFNNGRLGISHCD
ncbi:MAG: Cna domain protein [Gemmatimonadetes bacterium]|nr:Cna domain protein [Gemmatimonadota bacterium]